MKVYLIRNLEKVLNNLYVHYKHILICIKLLLTDELLIIHTKKKLIVDVLNFKQNLNKNKSC